MAIFSMNIAKVSKSGGKSAVGSSAYIHRQKYKSVFYENTFDYSRYKPNEYVYSEVLLCKNAPAHLSDPEQLWNEVEQVEKQSNSLLARRIIVALPRELNQEQQIDLVKDYAVENFTSNGMCVDMAIHFDAGNPHAHLLLTTRPFKENGEWGVKDKKVYALDEKGERIPLLDENGEQKIGAKGRKLWKRETVDCFLVNHRNVAEEWRSSWADFCNSRLKKFDTAIDHRSYERQGLDIEPTIHEGYSPQKRRFNAMVQSFRKTAKALMDMVKAIKVDFVDDRAYFDRREDFEDFSGEVPQIQEKTLTGENRASNDDSDGGIPMPSIARDKAPDRLAPSRSRERER